MKSKIALGKLIIGIATTSAAATENLYRWTDPESGQVVVRTMRPPFRIIKEHIAGTLPDTNLIQLTLDPNSPDVKDLDERRKMLIAEEKRKAAEKAAVCVDSIAPLLETTSVDSFWFSELQRRCPGAKFDQDNTITVLTDNHLHTFRFKFPSEAKTKSDPPPLLQDRLNEIQRGIDAARSLRATKLGITIEQLDNIEGRSNQNSGSSGNKIEIVTWTQRLSESKNYYYVEGVIENKSNKPTTSIKVKVMALRDSDELIALESGYSDPSSIMPGQRATFQIMIKNYPDTKKISVSLQYE